MKVLLITLTFLFSVSAKAQNFSCVSLFQQSQVELTDEVTEGLYKLAEDQVRTQKLPMSESKNMILREIKRQVFEKASEFDSPEVVFSFYRNVLSKISGLMREDSQTLSEERLRKKLLVEQKKIQEKIIKIKNQYDAETLEMALIRATEKNDIETVRFLISVGADVNGRDLDRNTALHWATGHSNVEITKLLLENHASVDLITNSGWTVLHTACFSRKLEIVQMVLDHGAWAYIDFVPPQKNNRKEQHTPLDWAKEQDKNIFDLLTNYLGKVQSPRGRKRPVL